MKHVVLTGFMASGKTAVGRRLARRLRWDFLDTDKLIEERQGRTIAEIFATDGEEAFRDIEHATIVGLAGELQRPTVIATGGGSFAAERNRKPLRRLGVVVCLVVSLPTILARIRRGTGVRPLAAGDDAEQRLKALLEKRMPAYRRADVLVETDGLTVDGAVSRVLSMIEPRLKKATKSAPNKPRRHSRPAPTGEAG
jgi:shikimate kinase